MGVIQLVVFAMVITVVATISLAVVAYAAFRLREGRAPAASLEGSAPAFFERVRFHLPGETAEG